VNYGAPVFHVQDWKAELAKASPALLSIGLRFLGALILFSAIWGRFF
jgi:hypothetical protein